MPDRRRITIRRQFGGGPLQFPRSSAAGPVPISEVSPDAVTAPCPARAPSPSTVAIRSQTGLTANLQGFRIGQSRDGPGISREPGALEWLAAAAGTYSPAGSTKWRYVLGVGMERSVSTPDGRVLAVEDAGDSAGSPVLVHKGTPNSRHLYGPNVADATAQGLRLIGYDRPGYGGSTPGRGGPSPIARAMSGRSAPRSGSTGWRCGAFRAAGRTCWRVRRCCPISSRRPPRSPRLRRTAPKGSTGSPTWARTTSTNSGCTSKTRARRGPIWTKTGK